MIAAGGIMKPEVLTSPCRRLPVHSRQLQQTSHSPLPERPFHEQASGTACRFEIPMANHNCTVRKSTPALRCIVASVALNLCNKKSLGVSHIDAPGSAVTSARAWFKPSTMTSPSSGSSVAAQVGLRHLARCAEGPKSGDSVESPLVSASRDFSPSISCSIATALVCGALRLASL